MIPENEKALLDAINNIKELQEKGELTLEIEFFTDDQGKRLRRLTMWDKCLSREYIKLKDER